MKDKECYYVRRGVPFDEQLIIKRIKNGVEEINACFNDRPGATIAGWIKRPTSDEYVRIPTWQAKAYWPYITKV